MLLAWIIGDRATPLLSTNAMTSRDWLANNPLGPTEGSVNRNCAPKGTPADIIEELKKVEARYPGLERVICTMPLGTHLSDTLEQLDRFATEVIPAFRPVRAAAAAD